MKLGGVPAAVPAEKAVEAQLLLSIDGLLYEVEVLPPAPGVPRRLAVRRQHTYKYRYEVEELASGQRRCACPAWKFGGACKHIAAVAAVGLLGGKIAEQ